MAEPLDDARMWHVTVTVAGAPVAEALVRQGLERLSHEHPFLLAGRYAADRAEIRYWDEAPDVEAAAAHAAGLWRMHRSSSDLPDWEVVGVEVVDRTTFQRRGRHAAPAGLIAAGHMAPF
jgi:hypothetical protein